MIYELYTVKITVNISSLTSWIEINLNLSFVYLPKYVIFADLLTQQTSHLPTSTRVIEKENNHWNLTKKRLITTVYLAVPIVK